MSAHTPGPWEAVKTVVYTPEGKILASFVRGFLDRKNHAEDVANANLVSAAPDLLEALEAYHFHFGILEENEFINAEARRCASLARAAIAKAKGETP